MFQARRCPRALPNPQCAEQERSARRLTIIGLVSALLPSLQRPSESSPILVSESGSRPPARKTDRGTLSPDHTMSKSKGSKEKKCPVLVSCSQGAFISPIDDFIMAADLANTSITPPELLEGGPGWPSGSLRWPLQGSLARFAAEWSAWQYVVTLLLGLVVYDQSKSPWSRGLGTNTKPDPVRTQLTPSFFSHVPPPKGLYLWPSVQNSAHGTFYPSSASEIRSISCPVGERASQLRLSLPQVRSHLAY